MDTDELPPVDLATICVSYAPHAVVARLLFIADRFSETVSVPSAGGAQNTSSGSQNHDHAVFPTLALDALKLAHAILKRGDNTALYVSVCERIGGRAGAEYDVDQEMVATKTKRATAKHESLQSDLAGYKTHTIKESIRVGYGDLGDFYRATGAFQDAIKAYARTRDYCTTARHVVSTCLDIARVGVEAENYQHVQNYCAKAAAAVGSGGGGVAGDSATGGGGTPSVASASHCAEPFALAELARAAGLAALEQRKYALAAAKFAEAANFATGAGGDAEDGVGSGDGLPGYGDANGELGGGASANTQAVVHGSSSGDEQVSEVLSTRDLATFGVLCCLCSCDNIGEMRKLLVENVAFRSAVEGERETRRLAELFVDHKFAEALVVLGSVIEKLRFDMHMHDHTSFIATAVREKALALYCAPFAVADLNQMAATFAMPNDVSALEKELTSLIQRDIINARVDSKNKTLHAKTVDKRQNAFAAVTKAGTEFISGARAALVRASLTEHGLVVGGGSSRRRTGAHSGHSGRHRMRDDSGTGMGMGMGKFGMGTGMGTGMGGSFGRKGGSDRARGGDERSRIRDAGASRSAGVARSPGINAMDHD